MSSIEHLKRWIVFSLFQDLKKLANGKFLYLEGEDNLNNKEAEHLELRIDGPYTKPCGSKGEYSAFIEVNILASSTRKEDNGADRFNLQGLMAHMLNRDFCIRRTGNEGKEPADDGTTVGTMQLLPVDQIKVSDFGQIDTSTQLFQSVAEAHYEMYFSLEPS